MTTTDFYATSHITGTVLTPANALGAPDNTWTTNVDNSTWTSRFAMGDPPTGDVLDGIQTITVRVRKETGTGTPTLTCRLYENGNFVTDLFNAQPITSTTGQDVQGTWDPTITPISDLSVVEIELVGVQSGGGPSARSTPQIDGITWTANHIAPAANQGRLKTAAGDLKPVKIWTGSAWEAKPVKVWTGSAWEPLP